MQDKTGLELGTAQRGAPGRSVLVKNTTAADMAIIRDVFGYKTDPIDGKTLIFSDMEQAINAVGANSRTNLGDTIYVSPGYVQTLSAASAIDQDTEGISIIGLGEGADRPTFTFSDVAATWTMAAANSSLKNVIVVPSVDSVVSPIVVSAADCTIDIESRDASATVEFVRAILTTADADNLNIKLKHQGFTGGNAGVNAIRLVGGSNTRIEIDYYGIASTAVVEFHTTAVIDCTVNGFMTNLGTSDFSKSVVDTATGSTWYAAFADGGASQYVSGGDQEALAAGDLSSMAAAIAVIDGYHDVPAKDGTDDAQMRDVIGKKEDDAAAGAVTTTESLVAYAKQNVGAGIDTVTARTVPTADAADNVDGYDVIGNKEDAAAAGAVSTVESLMAYAKQNVGAGIALEGNHVKGTTDAVTNTLMRDVIGSKDDAAATGVVTATESLMAYAKQNVNNTEDMVGLLAATLPAIELKSYADLTGYDTAPAFTVTGDVLVRCFGSVGAAGITSTSGTTTLSVGTTANPAIAIAATTIDNSDLGAGFAWTDNNPATDASALPAADWVFIAGGADIILTRNVDDITAGELNLYCEWRGVGPGGDVAAA